MKVKITDFQGKVYESQDRAWLKLHMGEIFDCVTHNINLVRLTHNGLLCHVYDCDEIREDEFVDDGLVESIQPDRYFYFFLTSDRDYHKVTVGLTFTSPTFPSSEAIRTEASKKSAEIGIPRTLDEFGLSYMFEFKNQSDFNSFMKREEL